MKKVLFLIAAAVAMVSCGSSARLMNSASYKKMDVQPMVSLIADLQVSPEKIIYTMVPTRTILLGGYDNVVNSAVREALQASGGYDVLVALETQVKYSADGQIESVTVSGYPARYTNFRSPDDSFWTSGAFAAMQNSQSDKSGAFSIPFGKKK